MTGPFFWLDYKGALFLDRGGQNWGGLSPTRREPISGGSSAASMPHTVWKSPPQP